jgi:hypothetical protein
MHESCCAPWLSCTIVMFDVTLLDMIAETVEGVKLVSVPRVVNIVIA